MADTAAIRSVMLERIRSLLSKDEKTNAAQQEHPSVLSDLDPDPPPARQTPHNNNLESRAVHAEMTSIYSPRDAVPFHYPPSLHEVDVPAHVPPAPQNARQIGRVYNQLPATYEKLPADSNGLVSPKRLLFADQNGMTTMGLPCAAAGRHLAGSLVQLPCPTGKEEGVFVGAVVESSPRRDGVPYFYKGGIVRTEPTPAQYALHVPVEVSGDGVASPVAVQLPRDGEVSRRNASFLQRSGQDPLAASGRSSRKQSDKTQNRRSPAVTFHSDGAATPGSRGGSLRSKSAQNHEPRRLQSVPSTPQSNSSFKLSASRRVLSTSDAAKNSLRSRSAEPGGARGPGPAAAWRERINELQKMEQLRQELSQQVLQSQSQLPGLRQEPSHTSDDEDRQPGDLSCAWMSAAKAEGKEFSPRGHTMEVMVEHHDEKCSEYDEDDCNTLQVAPSQLRLLDGPAWLHESTASSNGLIMSIPLPECSEETQHGCEKALHPKDPKAKWLRKRLESPKRDNSRGPPHALAPEATSATGRDTCGLSHRLVTPPFSQSLVRLNGTPSACMSHSQANHAAQCQHQPVFGVPPTVPPPQKGRRSASFSRKSKKPPEGVVLLELEVVGDPAPLDYFSSRVALPNPRSPRRSKSATNDQPTSRSSRSRQKPLSQANLKEIMKFDALLSPTSRATKKRIPRGYVQARTLLDQVGSGAAFGSSCQREQVGSLQNRTLFGSNSQPLWISGQQKKNLHCNAGADCHYDLHSKHVKMRASNQQRQAWSSSVGISKPRIIKADTVCQLTA